MVGYACFGASEKTSRRKGFEFLMTYEAELQWYRDYIERESNSPYRRVREYVGYLRRWFSEENCDGAPFSLKYKWKQLPMSYNVYMMG